MTEKNNENINDNKYFSPKIKEEEMPIDFNDEINKKDSSLQKIFDFYFKENSLSIAKDSSIKERHDKNISDSSFIYGEITFRSMAYIFEYIQHEFGDKIIEGNFYDLGSGEGKGIIAAALLYPFQKCVGIEYIKALHDLAIDVKNKYITTIQKVYDENKKLFPTIEKMPELSVINGDFLKHKFINPSIILANSTCFSKDLMENIAIKVEKECPSGTIIITFSKELPHMGKGIECLRRFRRVMTWGIATVYIHRKK